MELAGLLCVGVAVDMVCVVFGGLIGSYRQRTGLGVALGLFLGPIGVLIICLVPPPEPPKYRRS